MKMNLEQLWKSLARCRMGVAIDLLRPWVEESLPGDVELLIDACPVKLRGHLAVLLGDLMTGWPQGIVGVPVLLWCAHSEDKEPELRRVVLPGTGTQCSQPCDELKFLGWLDKGALLPAAGVRLADVEVGVGGSAVALFRVEPGVDVEEVEGIEIRPIWWGELLDEVPGSVYVSVGVVQSYPVALEVARAMVRAAGGAMGGEQVAGVFATRLEIEAGVEAGKVFKARAEAALQGSGSWTKGVGAEGDDELI